MSAALALTAAISSADVQAIEDSLDRMHACVREQRFVDLRNELARAERELQPLLPPPPTAPELTARWLCAQRKTAIAHAFLVIDGEMNRHAACHGAQRSTGRKPWIAAGEDVPRCKHCLRRLFIR